MGKGNRFKRPTGKRRYRKVFVISVEGTITEAQYLDFFNDSQNYSLMVKCLKSQPGKNSPKEVLERIKRHLKKNPLLKGDEAWLVADRDNWTSGQLNELHAWSQKKKKAHHLAVSNPKFEYWLLLHFEDGTKGKSGAACGEQLKKHLPDYKKHISKSSFPQKNIEKAVERAKKRDSPRCNDWPKTPGCTTVYKLVENILKAR